MDSSVIYIKDISGEILFPVLIASECEKVEELMKSDYIQLSWNSDSNDVIPAGSYIEYSGERYLLLEPYSPTQKNEAKYNYQPQFQSKVMSWGKVPFFMYTYSSDNAITGREPDWSLTDNPANFMSVVCKAIKSETGETWTYAVDASLPASATLSFQSIDIFSALNSIANAFDTEWWVDKSNKVLHLSKAEHGTAVELKVGLNINTPSVTNNKEGYYTRFYAFGSTRNIVQDYQGANVNNLINKRLTLDPKKYPGGYKDINSGLSPDEIFSKILVFDDVYPSSSLTISDVRVRLMWTLDESGNKVQIGTKDGEPVYDQYAIWYFSIPGFAFNNSVYSKENPDGMLISGKVLSVHFETGTLQDREFELIYHDKEETVSSADGTSVSLKPSDYEIKFKEEGTYIIPAITSLVPNDGDKIVLFNIRMPQEYVDSAYLELEAEMNKEIARLSSDLNNYQFSSNPVAFNESNPNLSIGRKVLYINGGYSYTTRVIKLITKLDYEYLQTITIGNDKIKGNTQEIKEEVASANKDINLLSVINDMTASLQQSYQRTQKMMLDGFAAIKGMWQFDPDTPNTIFSKYNFWTPGWISAKGIDEGSGSSGEGGASALYQLNDVAKNAAGNGVLGAEKNSLLAYDGTHWYGIPQSAISPDLAGYAKEEWVTSQLSGYATVESLNTVSDRLNDFLVGTDTDNIINKWKELENFLSGFTETDTLAGALGNKADKSTKVIAGAGLIGGGDLSSNITFALPATGVSAGTYSKVTVDVYGRVTSGASLSVDDIPSLSISKITGLQDVLDNKLDKKDFTDLFERINIGTDASPKYAIHAKYGLYADWLSAKGVDEGSGSGGLDETELWSILGNSGNEQISLTHLTEALSGYATQDWVTGQLSGVGGGSVDGIILNGKTYSPDEETKLITLPNYPTSMDWGSITNTPSTLEGYGITDAYTKAESNANYVIKSGDTMTGSLYINSGDIGTTLKLFSTAGDTYIRMINKGVDIGGFGVSAEYGVYMYNNNSASRTYVNSDGELLHNDYTVLHEGNYSGVLDNRYVLKAGDTMTGDLLFSAGKGIASSTGVLEVGRYSGTIYLQGNSLYYSPVNGTNFPILHTGNYTGELDSRYVLKSGDTVTGIMNFQNRVIVNSSVYGGTPTISLAIGDSDSGFNSAADGQLQMYGDNTVIANWSGSGFTFHITPTVNGNTIWHSGNDGSGSGLDADMLDGLHYTSFARKDAWQANNLNDINDTGIMTNYANADATVERNYPIQEAGILIYGTAAYKSSNQIYGTYSSNRWFARGGGGSAQTKTSWREFAFTDSNVASATRLQTPRTIWGRSFDGTSNISGWLSGATTIECSTGVRCRNICIETESDGTAGSRGSEINCFTSPLYLQHATSYGVIMCNGGGNVGIGVAPDYKLHVNGDILANGYIHSVNNGVSSSFGAQNSSYCHISTNAAAFWFSSELRINGSILPYNGSHWIGTADSPWGYVFSNGWFRSLGNTGWYNQTYSGGIYMTDSTYVRVYSKEWFRSDMYSAGRGGYQDDAYSVAYNAAAPSDKNYCCYSFVRYGITPFGIGFNVNNEIWIGTVNKDRLSEQQWLHINSSGVWTDGYMTAKETSDRRLKKDFDYHVDYQQRILDLGKIVDFNYNEKALTRSVGYADDKRHTSVIYQDALKANITGFCMEADDGYGVINPICPDLIFTAIGAIQMNIMGLRNIAGRTEILEEKVARLDKENKKMKSTINKLKSIIRNTGAL